jgi:probable HAF family extracellular repeat protein
MKIIPGFKAPGFILAAAFLAGLGFGTSASAQEGPYLLIDLNSKTVTDLGTLGATDSRAFGINNAGQVVGWSVPAGGTPRAFITGPNGTGTRDLGTLGGSYSLAFGINDAGQVVGGSSTTGGQFHAFITGPNGRGMTDLGVLPGSVWQSVGYAINNTGQVTGESTTADARGHAFITGPNGVGMTDLGTLPGENSSMGKAINDAGQVAGEGEAGRRAFITGPNGVGMTDLGALDGTDRIEVNAINNAGYVAGNVTVKGAEGPFGPYTYHAFIAGPNGMGMTDLGTLGGSSYAYGINDAGQVVGESYTADGHPHAFITGPNGAGMTDLNSLVKLPVDHYLWTASAINDQGQVLVRVGTVPEPETYALLLTGLGLIGFIVRHKRREARKAN